VVVEVALATGDIAAADVTVSSSLALDYLVRLLVGKNLMGELGAIVKDIERDYHSASQKAIIQAFHDLGQQYMADYLKIMANPFGDLDL
jgi:hypothetical protein